MSLLQCRIAGVWAQENHNERKCLSHLLDSIY